MEGTVSLTALRDLLDAIHPQLEAEGSPRARLFANELADALDEEAADCDPS